RTSWNRLAEVVTSPGDGSGSRLDPPLAVLEINTGTLTQSRRERGQRDLWEPRALGDGARSDLAPGHLVYRHRQMLSTPEMYAAFALVAALGLGLTRGLRALQARMLVWPEGVGRL